MSKGAIFNLINRDERTDKFLLASDYLREKLDRVREDRKRRGEKNVQPCFADIESSHTLYIHSLYKPFVAVASEYSKVKPSGDGGASIKEAGGSIQFTLPNFGHFTSDMAVRFRLAAIGTQRPTGASPLFRYCELPGVRLLKLTSFLSDETLIDDYDPDDVNNFTKVFLNTDFQSGYFSCVGEQTNNFASYAANGFSATVQYSDGPQTPKTFQPALELMIPLWFWMCRDPSTALLNDLIPNSQRIIRVELESLSKIVEALDPATLNQIPLPFTELTIEACELYVNNLYVNPEIHDVFASRIGFQLARVHQRQKNQLTTSSGKVLLNQLKYPAEFMIVGIRNPQNMKDFDLWPLMGTPFQRTNATALAFPASIWNPVTSQYDIVTRIASDVSSLAPMVDSIGLVTQGGIVLFAESPALFYNGYLPLRYFMSTIISTPFDKSIWLIPFSLFQDKLAPSGYFNLSTGRETYFQYSGNNVDQPISVSSPGELVISMIAFNFILRHGSGISLRYST